MSEKKTPIELGFTGFTQGHYLLLSTLIGLSMIGLAVWGWR
jgi:hypothetical protein